MNNNITIKKNIFRYQISNGEIVLKSRLRPWVKVIFGFFILSIIVSFFLNVNFSFSSNGLGLFFNNIKDFFKASSISKEYGNQNLWLLSFKFLFESIKIIFFGTIVGVTLALITAYFSNYKTNSKWIAFPFRSITIFLRICPELLFVYLFSATFDKILAINLILSWSSWLWLHEYFSQSIENANYTIYWHLTKSSHSKFKAFMTEIWPQIKQKVFGYIFYAFESNLRWSTILSRLGFLGIGLLIVDPEKNTFSELLIPLFVLVTFTFLLELFHLGWNKYIIASKSHSSNHKSYQKEKTLQTLVKVFVAIFCLIMVVLSIQSLIGQRFYPDQGKDYLRSLFLPNWNELSLSGPENIFKIVYELISLVAITILVVFVISKLKLFFLNSKTNSKPKSIIFKLCNSFARTIPTIVLFFLIEPIFKLYPAAFVFAFAIHSASTLTKNLENSIQKINQNQIVELKKQGYSSLKIYRNFILPTIKKDTVTMFSFEIEKIIRNFITYGIFSSSLIGIKSTLSVSRTVADIAPYLWIGALLIALVNLLSIFIRLKAGEINLLGIFSKKRKIIFGS
ncbi:ABC-type phosphate/phosphonate transport system, permease component [Metamycoplasma arthritidis]|uniref:ABC-type phosphate/phosphonate transport system, permease component n=1 Tax=Metamycoplasma arthritidis (strain 158L3-1) TaxID=243272 RepID=B3PLZ3_META1|nr:ABC transporter permease subunit [Metamycoplasma arthritidis]ACF07045.1 ABC-type phosphate/phosphonate transport system, permease component [Metamycoplasma arthritidis 158L3-1]VEU78574.1 ABC-type phosphate/phosphonate transport system, permease component [Metamycoplasma arthritidis]